MSLDLWHTPGNILSSPSNPTQGCPRQPPGTCFPEGRGPRDLPGVNYHAIRGKGDFPPLLNRRNGRSKYGAKKLKKVVAKNTLTAEVIPGYALNYVAKRRFLMYGWSLHKRAPRRHY